MKIHEWWPLVSAETRDWLIAHNGETLSPPVTTEILAVTGSDTEAGWWAGESGDGAQLTDAAVDWIEGIANGESPAPVN